MVEAINKVNIDLVKKILFERREDINSEIDSLNRTFEKHKHIDGIEDILRPLQKSYFDRRTELYMIVDSLMTAHGVDKETDREEWIKGFNKDNASGFVDKRIATCWKCNVSGVRIYRFSASSDKAQRCNKCIDPTELKYYVPCVLDWDGSCWGHTSIPGGAVAKFFALPENDTGTDAPTWGEHGWMKNEVEEKV